MESAVQLNNSLTFLAYTTGAIVLIAGLMLTKVLFDFSRLTKNIDETVVMAKAELEPTLKNINKSVEIVSGIVIKTDENIKKVKSFISKTPLKLLGGLSKLTAKASRGFWSGLGTALKMFSKK
ncbi:MAG: hypothetical protein MJ230_01355 [bacterium]|nr:hypothetical protein [bacterium]